MVMKYVIKTLPDTRDRGSSTNGCDTHRNLLTHIIEILGVVLALSLA